MTFVYIEEYPHICPGQYQPDVIQSGALSLVGRFEAWSFVEPKYFHDVATPALLCHKEPARR